MIHIPPDAKVIRDARLTIVRTIGTLYERHVNGDGGLKDKIKADMLKKSALFAESDHVVARLMPGAAKMTIDPVEFFKLVCAKKITQSEFLSCVTVNKTAARELLSPRDIEAVSKEAPAGGPILFTEFKPGISASLEEIDLSSIVVKMLLREAA